MVGDERLEPVELAPITATGTVLTGIAATSIGATAAVYFNAVAGLLVAVAGLVVLVLGFELAGRVVDGPRPAEAEACFCAHHPLGGWRPAGRSPAEATCRPVGGSTKSNTTFSLPLLPTLPDKGDRGAIGAALGKSRLKVTAPALGCREQRKRRLGKPWGGQR